MEKSKHCHTVSAPATVKASTTELLQEFIYLFIYLFFHKNSKLKKKDDWVKTTFTVICPFRINSPFDTKQFVKV